MGSNNQSKGTAQGPSQTPVTNTSGSTFNKHSDFLGRSVKDFHELYKTESMFSDGKMVKAYPHMLGLKESDVKVIPYNDLNGTDQKDLVSSMGKRRVLISIKHHATKPDQDPKEKVKLQCTHIQLVARSGNEVFTFNNPQDYQQGLFGESNYPMIYLELAYPEGVTESDIIGYEDNIISWASLINTFSEFPGDYNGGDPLSAKTKNEVHLIGKMALQALAGDQSAIGWFKKPENKLYCAELAYVALTLGLTFPLNDSFLSQDELRLLGSEFSSKAFLSGNNNPQVKSVDLRLPTRTLKPLVSPSDADFFGKDLAIRPMLVSDLITAFVKYSVNREHEGESSGIYQNELFQASKGFVSTYLPPGALATGTKLSSLYTKVEDVLKTNHGTYKAFRLALKPVLEAIDKEVATLSSAANTFIPPHTYLVRALELKLENKVKGLVGYKYFGHGVHEDLI